LFTKEMSKSEFEKMMNMVVKITEDLIDDYEWNYVA